MANSNLKASTFYTLCKNACHHIFARLQDVTIRQFQSYLQAKILKIYERHDDEGYRIKYNS